jgi:hypothetical protein
MTVDPSDAPPLPSAERLDPSPLLQPMPTRVDPKASHWARLTFRMRRGTVSGVAARWAPQKGHAASWRFTWRLHEPHGS